MPAPLVSVSTAVAADVPVYLDEIGKTYAYESVVITPQVGGRITEREFQDGADLKKGQLLFAIDPRPFQAALDSAQAQLAQAKAALQLAQTQLKMYDTLNDTRAVSQLDYETKKNAVDVDKAQIQSAEAAVETAKLNLDYCAIHSPIDGRAGARLVDVGNVVQANSTQLLSIQRLEPIYSDFTITEQDLTRVRQDMARGNTRALVRLPSETDAQARPGALTFLDNSVQNGSGTVFLRATIPNADHHFWPGQFVNVRLVLTTMKDAVLVPNQATQISQQGPYVMVLKPDDTADMRKVELGQRQDDNVVIISGVKAGERVITAGQANVLPGAKVRIGPAGPPASPGASSPKGN
ncbi:MAG TPA: efflux RND transporter periplasmic adaptor subunit [Candidatus Acidoferrales bacterium]|nr:efflux RND transporter periplasmic adaptor subunit [Candidatus Acidoferrales bacterium]